MTGQDGVRTELLYEITMDAEVDDLGQTPKYGWLNRILAIGIGRRTSREVAYTVYEVL